MTRPSAAGAARPSGTKKRLAGRVVVITGASSGIGRATAHRMADEGARLVLAARDAGSLDAAVDEVRSRGAEAISVTVDVSEEAAVEALARAAVQSFGRIDVWVNNAGVYAFGRADETPSDVIRQVLAVNLEGTVYGSCAALRHFRGRGSGVLINVASGFGKVAAPLISSYVASKFAIVGYSQALRMELVDDENIHVCCVLPSTIDTPIFQHAANFTGRAPRALPPVHPVGLAADAIVECALRPRAEVYVGGIGRLAAIYRWFAPAAYEASTARQVEAMHFRDGSAPATTGNLFAPMPESNTVEGGWLDSKVAAPTVPMPLLAGVAGLAGGLITGFAVVVKRRRRPS
ncbi:MAG: hypothetical protein QOH61_596 [Chloroflexota bacterium]|nr:hypothetical protein [Chloroflexota bacterium]